MNGLPDPRHDAYQDLSDRPFYGLEVIDGPYGVTVELTFANPVPLARAVVGDQPAYPGLAQIEQLFAGRFTFTLDSPFEVVSTNATRREGHKLTWEIPIADPAAKLQEILIARFKK